MQKYNSKFKILSIDTSCDETAASVTEGTKILSNIIWSQAASHAKFGGVMPSLARREHENHIDFVIKKALKTAFPKQYKPGAYSLLPKNIDAVAVTVGPGLSIALGVGIDRAKKLAIKYRKKLIAVNHIEGHILSSEASPRTKNIKYPALGLVVSGGNTILVKINRIGSYKILAQTVDDALGEALDKAARMLGLGYPGRAILEKFAKLGDPAKYKLPIPMVGQEERKIFSYSGLKTAFSRLVESEKPLTKEKIVNLAASYQDVAFSHLVRIVSYIIHNSSFVIQNFFVGGGVSANIELRKRLRKLGKDNKISIHFPYSKKLMGDNAAMVGIAAYFKAQRGEFSNTNDVDRIPGLKIDS